MHRHVADGDVLARAAEVGGEPAVEVLDVDVTGGLDAVRDVDREHRRADVVGDEEDAVRSERDRAGGPDRRGADRHPTSRCLDLRAHLILLVCEGMLPRAHTSSVR